MTAPTTAFRGLALGLRFALTGGRPGLLRTTLTAAGTGVVVTLLLLLTSVPGAVDAREARDAARTGRGGVSAKAPGPDTLLVAPVESHYYRDRQIKGVLLRPEGPKAPVPPGLTRTPGAGEMALSPALRDLLRSERGALLRERLPFRDTGTIGPAGLRGPGELVYYVGDAGLAPAAGAWPGARRISAFGGDAPLMPLPDEVSLIGALGAAAVLLPAGVLLATAVRFGGERRDRRLAALRLVGADSRMTRWVAAGEALSGTLLGLAVGAAGFLAVRQGAPAVRLRGAGVFPSDLVPGPLAVTLIVLGVPLAAVAVALFALRDVAIEPLGVVRGAARGRRRLWWRLPVPLAGLALLVPGLSHGRVLPQTQHLPYRLWLPAAGSVLLLGGVVLLLPWVVQACVARLRGGAPAWQLAVRRLQLDSGPAARAVSGIVVAVAGAVAVQMLVGAESARGVNTPRFPDEVLRVHTYLQPGADGRQVLERFRTTPGARSVTGTVEFWGDRGDGTGGAMVKAGDCEALRRLARLESCRDGDVFLSYDPAQPRHGGLMARPGDRLRIRRDGGDRTWTVPDGAPTVTVRPDAYGTGEAAVLATPAALDARGVTGAVVRVAVEADPKVPDAVEHLRTTAAAVDPALRLVDPYAPVREDDMDYWPVQRALPVGAAVVFALVAAGLLLATFEQLRERRRTLATLAAFGVRPATLAWSLVWQTAVPVVLGLALAVAGGAGLGRLLLWALRLPVRDWFAFVPVVGTGLVVVTLFTLAALLPLRRLSRPEGLRSE
ncbi:membrane protein [Streptomyces mashuensis]|uniref:Membrane protein n=1 Tax=Streptomyces mashuensis TaxID=33904 RepID=A0A919EEX8_9ACTN|nr:FtsX-like permease family protein [Streptomyces mashuensis]GHF60840.1 membrane protein [Streptomyces mashuensis]